MSHLPSPPTLQDDPRHSTNSKWGGRVSGDGQLYTETYIDPETGRYVTRPIETDPGAEFPTPWHRERYLHDLTRSLRAAEANRARIEQMHPDDRGRLERSAAGLPETDPAPILKELRRVGTPTELAALGIK